jgi:hypothetical protein
MAKFEFELSYNYDRKEFDKFLEDRKLKHLKNHKDWWLKVGDALRSEKGVIARVVNSFSNKENLSIDFTIANNVLDRNGMQEHFGG